MTNEVLSASPIGYIRTAMRVKFEAPHQPLHGENSQNVVELLPNLEFRRALKDLSGFDYIWLIWWFHKNKSWRPEVRPPRGPSQRRGVFATRSPHRPNPIGLTAVKLIKVEGLKLTIGDCDLVDGTPILDIKPYLKGVDSFPEASLGWLAEVEELERQPPAYTLQFSDLASEQVAWLKERGIDLMQRAKPILERDPSAHRTRRIYRYQAGLRMGCGAWRLYYEVQSNLVLINKISPGFPMRFLMRPGYEDAQDRDAQLAFGEKWGHLFDK